MAKSIQEDYKTLVDFWNQNFALEEEEKKQLEETSNDDSWKELPPSAKLFDVLTSFKGKEHVLDYGCGSGWGSLVMAKSGVSRITAVDVANNSLEMLRCYAKAYGVELRRFYANWDSNIQVVQIPHHGSWNNFSSYVVFDEAVYVISNKEQKRKPSDVDYRRVEHNLLSQDKTVFLTWEWPNTPI